ncbi:MAG: cyclic pyranopterin monophosphate synthase MoaC, partial [Planctomycetota bacterium]
RLSHLTAAGALRMVDVSAKTPTLRTARARGAVRVGTPLARLLRRGGNVAKGNLFEAARLAGILAAKQVDRLIPLCHSLPLDGVQIDFTLAGETVHIEAQTRTTAKTGVEMEALTAVTLAALTIYDMGKAVNKHMVIGPIELIEKTGGKSGSLQRHRGNPKK